MKHNKTQRLSTLISVITLVPALLLPFEQLAWAASSYQQTGFKQTDSSEKTDATHRPAQLSNSRPLHQSSQPQAMKTSAYSKLPVMTNGQSALVSNAENFHGAWNASVDPRTGNASFSFTVESILFNHGEGRHDLQLSYSGGSSARGPDPFDLGIHWQWNVGREYPSPSEIAGHLSTDIITGDGHRFTMVTDRNASGKTIWRPLRHKLGDVLITGHPGDWTIATAAGIRQHIHKGYESWEEDRTGQRIYFYYNEKGSGDKVRHLTRVCSHPLSRQEQQSAGNICGHDGVQITYSGHNVIVHGGRTVTIHRNEINGLPLIDEITLPSLSSPEVQPSGNTDNILFSYDVPGKRPWLLRQVNYPTGLQKTFLYNNESGHTGVQTQGLPAGINNAHVSVVTEEITTSSKSDDMPPVKVWYRYGSASDNKQGQHNYLGYQGPHSIQPGKDNLFDRPGSYTYSVTRDNGATTVTTVYNKYHLPLSIRQYDSQNKSLLSVSEQHYPPWRQTTFSLLPANYSLAKSKNQTLYALSEKGRERSIEPARVIQSSKYNSNGQIIWQKDPYGRITMTRYCPPAGNSHCPPMDSRWPKVTQPEKILTLPATRSPTGSRPFITMDQTEKATEAREVIFDYVRLPAIAHQPDENDAVEAPSFFWQVLRKTNGTIPVVQLAGLTAGDTLPELKPEQLDNQTLYEYDMDIHRNTYGKMTRLTLINFPKPAPDTVQGTPLFSGKAAAPITSMEKTSFDIDNQIDSTTDTRTISISATPTLHPAKNIAAMAEKETGMQLGTTVYSLKTGNKLISRDTLKTVSTSWKYDLWNRPLMQITSPVNGGYPRKTRWTYLASPQENAIIKTLPEGEQFKTVLSAMDQKISTSHRFPATTDAGPAKQADWIPDTDTTYTASGKIRTRVKWRADDPAPYSKAGKAIALKTTYGYDILNRQTWVQNPDGQIKFIIRDDPHMLIMTYHAAIDPATHEEIIGQMLTVAQSNILGKPVATYLLPLNRNIKKRGNYLYSLKLKQNLQRLLLQKSPISQLQSRGSYGILPIAGLLNFVQQALVQHAWLTRTTWSYDGHGRKVSQRAGNGALTRWFYKYDHLVATTTADGRIIHDTFNIRGDKTARCVQPAGTHICHVTGTRRYDTGGHMRWEADAYGQKILYEHDADGRLLKMITPADNDTSGGHVFSWHYNSLGPTEKMLDGRTRARYHYDPVTWKLTDSDDAISHIHYSYAPDTGALQSITRSAPDKDSGIAPMPGIHYPCSTEVVKLDRYLQVISMTDMAGNTYITTHDRLGRSIETHVILPHTSVPVMLIKTSYDVFGRPAAVTNGIGIRRYFTYDALGQVTSTRDYHPEGSVQTLVYTYDPDTHNILTFTRTTGKQSATQTYHYDLQNNLDEMRCTATGTLKPSELCPRDTDTGHSQFTTPPVIIRQKYSFDRWNNIQTVEETGVESIKNTEAYTKKTTYTYADAGQPALNTENYDPHRLISYQTRWSNQVYSTSPDRILYDKQGRIIQDADGNQLHYNASGAQDRFINAHTHEVTHYTHDSDGHLAAIQPFDSDNHPLQTPLYRLYRGNTVTAQMQESNHQLHISVELGGVAHSEDGRITRWYLHDYKGDLLAAFNAEGVKMAENLYSPYGMKYNLISTHIQVLPQVLAQSTQQQWWRNHLPGFNNQMSDPATGYQLAGNGYRAYNPVYRRFMTRDSFSPFTEIDGYGFGHNNPIMNTDPSGHSAHTVEYLYGSFTIAMAAMMAVLIPVAATGLILSESIIAVSYLNSLVINGLNIATGSLQIEATRHPERKKVQLANLVCGTAAALTGLYSSFLITAAGTITGLRNTLHLANNRITGSFAFKTVPDFLTGLSGSGAMLSHSSAAVAKIPQITMFASPSLAEKKTWKTADRSLMLISLIGMGSSLLSGMISLGIKYYMATMTDDDSGKIMENPADQENTPAQNIPPEDFGESEEDLTFRPRPKIVHEEQTQAGEIIPQENPEASHPEATGPEADSYQQEYSDPPQIEMENSDQRPRLIILKKSSATSTKTPL